jgi:hypothetical protein
MRLGSFANIKQAEEWARLEYPDKTFDFARAHIDCINPTLVQFKQLGEEYPEVMAHITGLGTFAGKGQPNLWRGKAKTFWAGWFPGTKRIGLNPSVYGKPDVFRKQLISSAASGYHPSGCDTFESVMTHEFGHALQETLRHGNIAATQVVRASGEGTWGVIETSWTRRNHLKAPAVSAYGASSPDVEGWAESFAAIHHQPKGQWKAHTAALNELLTVFNSTKHYSQSQWKWALDLPHDERTPLLSEADNTMQSIFEQLGWGE